MTERTIHAGVVGWCMLCGKETLVRVVSEPASYDDRARVIVDVVGADDRSFAVSRRSIIPVRNDDIEAAEKVIQSLIPFWERDRGHGPIMDWLRSRFILTIAERRNGGPMYLPIPPRTTDSVDCGLCSKLKAQFSVADEAERDRSIKVRRVNLPRQRPYSTTSRGVCMDVVDYIHIDCSIGGRGEMMKRRNHYNYRSDR